MVTKAQRTEREQAANEEAAEAVIPQPEREDTAEPDPVDDDVDDDNALEPMQAEPEDAASPEPEPNPEVGTTDMPEHTPEQIDPEEPKAQAKARVADLSKVYLEEYMPENCEDLVRLLLYGDPGVGKTTGIAALARIGKIVLIDPERRMKKSALRRAGIPIDNIHHHTDVSYDGLNNLADRLEAALDKGRRYAGVCWDAATESQRLFIMQQVDEGVAEAASKGMERSAFRIYQDDYGDVGEMMRRCLRRFTALPVHLGMSALAKDDKDNNGAKTVAPNLTPSVWRDVAAAFDIIGHVTNEEVGTDIQRMALFHPIGIHAAKETFGILPRRLVDPTFDRVLAYVGEKVTVKTDPVQQAAIAARRAAASPTPKESK